MRLEWLLFIILSITPQLQALTNAGDNGVEKLAKDFEATKKSIIDDEIKQRKIMSSLFEINRKMKKIVSERSDLVQERMMLEATTKKLAEKIVDLDSHLKTQKGRLRDRLSAIYKFGGQGTARLLFSSSSSAQLERNLKILGLVAKQDLDLIKDYSITAKELNSKKQKFTQRLSHLQNLEKKIHEQETLLGSENRQKNRILDGIRKSKQFALVKLHGIRARSSMFVDDESGVFDLLFRPSFFEQKGQLPAPTNGQISESFGLIKDESSGVVLSNKGVFFSVPAGAPVKSVFAGKVSFVGDVPGFGKTIIVDHGDHYYTVYAHNSKVLTNVDQEINQNQVIAQTGSEVADGRSGLYFEVRHFSEPYDPRQWMKGMSL